MTQMHLSSQQSKVQESSIYLSSSESAPHRLCALGGSSLATYTSSSVELTMLQTSEGHAEDWTSQPYQVLRTMLSYHCPCGVARGNGHYYWNSHEKGVALLTSLITVFKGCQKGQLRINCSKLKLVHSLRSLKLNLFKGIFDLPVSSTWFTLVGSLATLGNEILRNSFNASLELWKNSPGTGSLESCKSKSQHSGSVAQDYPHSEWSTH